MMKKIQSLSSIVILGFMLTLTHQTSPCRSNRALPFQFVYQTNFCLGRVNIICIDFLKFPHIFFNVKFLLTCQFQDLLFIFSIHLGFNCFTLYPFLVGFNLSVVVDSREIVTVSDLFEIIHFFWTLLECNSRL